MNAHTTSRRLAFTLLATLCLTACDSIPFMDNTPDYKGAGRGRPLEVPPDLTSASTSDTYSLPGGATYSAYSQGQTAQPEEEKLLASPDNVKLERAGSQRWLVVQAAPEKVWPIVREFWTDLGFAVRIEDIQTGVMETEWLDPTELTKDDNGNYLGKFQGWLDKVSALNNRLKFRTRIDRGTEDSTTEIYMSHRSLSSTPDDGKVRVHTAYGVIDTGYKKEELDNKGKTDEAKAAAEDLDAELLRRLTIKLGISEQQSRSIVASPSQDKHAILGKDKSGNATLTVNDQFDRAWRRVGLALDRIGFLVEDKDRSRGMFYVKYAQVTVDDSPGQKKGLLDKLKFWGDDDQDKKAEAAPKKEDKGLVDKLKFWEADKSKPDADNKYGIKVEYGENNSLVTVTDKNGQVDHSPTANHILNMLYEQLK